MFDTHLGMLIKMRSAPAVARAVWASPSTRLDGAERGAWFELIVPKT
jgi:hypothetical protein